MRPTALLVHICVVLLPMVYGQWYNSVLASGPTCEDVYGCDSCLDNPGCVLLFMECECVPLEMRNMLNGDSEDGHTLCLLADIIMGLGPPTCCMARKRTMLRSFGSQLLPNGNLIGGHPSPGENAIDELTTSATSAKKRTTEVSTNRGSMEKTLDWLVKGAVKITDSNDKPNTRSGRRSVDDDKLNTRNVRRLKDDDELTTHSDRGHEDEILLRTLYDYLKLLLSRKDEPYMASSLKKRSTLK